MPANAAISPVTVGQFLERGRERLRLELAAGEAGLDRTVHEAALNRPGLALAGRPKRTTVIPRPRSG